MKVQDKLNITMAWLSLIAPWTNLVVPVGLVAMLGYFHFDHIVSAMLGPYGWYAATIIGVLYWILFSGARIALIIASARDFSNREFIEGTLGLFASLAVLIFDLWFLGKITAMAFPNDNGTMVVVLRFTSVLATIMEIRLVLLLVNMTPRQRLRKSGTMDYDPADVQMLPGNVPSTNGTSTKKGKTIADLFGAR